MSGQFRGDIEGLRAVAVLLILAYHAGIPGFSGGFVGVDVFFVISGYLITGLLAAEISSTGSIDFLKFYARRARRLLPAVSLIPPDGACPKLSGFSPVTISQLSKSAFSATIFVSNYWFLHAAVDYFGDHSGANPFLHTWSLGVEEQFYVVWPLLVLLSGRSQAHSRSSLAICVVLTAVSRNCMRSHDPYLSAMGLLRSTISHMGVRIGGSCLIHP